MTTIRISNDHVITIASCYLTEGRKQTGREIHRDTCFSHKAKSSAFVYMKQINQAEIAALVDTVWIHGRTDQS
jgi:hypothetical protein